MNNPNITRNATTETAPPRYQQVQQLYRVAAPDEVSRFLNSRAFLIPFLLEARDAIERYFPGCPVDLEVFADPEIADWVQLVAAIVPQGSPDDTLAREQRFQSEWWVPRMDMARNALLIMPEYR